MAHGGIFTCIVYLISFVFYVLDSDPLYHRVSTCRIFCIRNVFSMLILLHAFLAFVQMVNILAPCVTGMSYMLLSHCHYSLVSIHSLSKFRNIELCLISSVSKFYFPYELYAYNVLFCLYTDR